MIIKHTLFLGLNDQTTKQQDIDTLTAFKIVMRSVANVGYDGATITEATGFYTHENGEFVIEKSLQIQILFANDDQTNKLIDQLKSLFNQESIALQIEKIESKLV